jgi:hypothetical protein
MYYKSKAKLNNCTCIQGGNYMNFPENVQKDLPEDLTIEKAIELLLAAIAYEQFALGNIIDAEADKINHAVSLSEKGLATLEEVRVINDSAFNVLKAVLKKEMLLEFELEDLVDFIPKPSISSTTTTTSTSTTTVSTSTTTSQTSTCSTTTNRCKYKWHDILEVALFLICLATSRN